MDTEIYQEQELRACTSNREVDENDDQQILLGPNHSDHSTDGRQFIEFNSGKTSDPQVSCGSRIPRLALKPTIALLGVLLLVFISLYGMAQSTAQRNQTNVDASFSASKAQQPNLCTSEACISASTLLQSSIDPTANPCQDFYSFACGGFQKSHPFTAETVNSVIDRQHQAKNAINGLMFELMYYKHLAKSDDAELNELFQTARYFYMTCMNTLSPGSHWSSQSELLPKNWKTSNRYSAQELFSSPLIAYLEGFDTVEDFVARLVMSGSSGLLGLDVKAAEKNMLSNSGRLISFAALRFSNFHSGNASVQIEKIRMQCRLLGLKLTAPVEQLLTVESEMRATRFIMMLGLRGSGAKTEQRPQTAVQLDLKTAWQSSGLRFRWTKFVTRLSALSGCKQIKQAHIVIKGFSKLISLLQKLEPQVRARRGSYYDFIRLQAVLSALPNSSSSNFGQKFYNSLIFNHRSTIESIFEERSEVSKYSETCMNISVNSMPLVVLEMFRSAYVNDSFDTVESMTHHIQQAMEQNARNEAWISAENKRKIKQKLSGIRRESFLKRRELSGLKETYREIVNRVKFSRNYGDILLAFKDVAIRNALVFMTDENPLESATIMVLSDIRRVNAFYVEPLKSILILPGILHTFLYNKDYPDYLLYGGIGSVVGHELAHAFGNDSDKFNGTAQKREYRNRFQCLIRSYDQLIESEVGKLGRRMGNNTANDNFADIVGTNAAFRAYRASVARSQRSGREPQMLPGQLLSTLTADQLFFIQDAQFHCSKAEKHIRLIIALYFEKHAPSKSRVNGKMMHSNDFARAFSCKPGDRMYLSDDQKCHFW